LKKWRGLKDLVQAAVDKGATAIEEVHRHTSARPFELLEKVPGIAAPVRGVRQLHDLAVAVTYGMVRWVNRLAGKTVDVALDALERQDR
jgi:hypothetical protein